MNERIKELAEQATSLYQTMDGEWEEDFDKEKFAELIIEECIALGTNFTNRNFSEDAGELIAKNFGVEE